MLLRKFRHHIFIGGGCGCGCGCGCGSLFFKSLVNYSTAARTVQPQNGGLPDYLINSLGFSTEAAVSTSNKVLRLKPIETRPVLVVNFLENLGMSKTQVRMFVASCPKILFYDVDKTLVPKIKVFEEVGLSGLDIVRMIMNHKSLLVKGLNSFIIPRIEYFRKLFGTDDRVIAAFKRYALKTYKLENVKQNILLLQTVGFTDDGIVKLIVKDPKNILFASAEKLKDTLRRVENDLGIPRESVNFHYGIFVLGSFSQSNIDRKFEIFKSFGWSDASLLEMIRILPLVLCISADRMRQGLDYFMKELGYSPEYLASHPVLLSLNLERRVKPRNEVLKILNEKKVNKRKAILYTLSIKPEARFVKEHILPYKNLLPDMCAEYFEKVGREKTKK